MPITHAEFVDRFGSAILAGNAAIFVGAGLSRAAGFPDWGGLLAPLQERCGIPPHSDLPLVAEYIEQDVANGGRGALEDHILKIITATAPTPTRAHLDMQKLPVKEIWTTNYDTLLEHSIPDAVVIAGEDEIHSIASRRKAIIKMHGSIGLDNTWQQPPVVTRSDYERYEVDHPRTWTVLRSSYMSRSLLFLGFSFTDPNIEILLRLARTLGTATGDRHVAIMKPPTDPSDLRLYELRAADLEASGVTICQIDDHNEIPTLLAALVLRTRPPQVFVAGSANLPNPTPEEEDEVVGSWCAAVATQLADETAWTIASLGGRAGWCVSRDTARLRRDEETYEPDSLVIHFRGKNQPPVTLEERVGTSIYSDLEREQLVAAVLDQSRALLAICGGSKTAEEIEWAAHRRVAVIPIAGSGGAAERYWNDHRSDPPDIGSRPTEPRTWELLASPDPTTAARAAKRLLLQAMYEGDGTKLKRNVGAGS